MCVIYIIVPLGTLYHKSLAKSFGVIRLNEYIKNVKIIIKIVITNKLT